MIIKNSQQNVVIDIPNNVINIALKISGGADSAALAYILALYKKTHRPNLNIHTITSVAKGKAYQDIFASNILKTVENLTDVKFGKRFVNVVDPFNYVIEQQTFAKELENEYSLLYIGETKNPPISLSDTYQPPTDRDGNNMPTELGINRMPFKNINKKGIKELYITLGIIDTIFPITRSCEDLTDDFSSHCGNCWFCLERIWGFDSL